MVMFSIESLKQALIFIQEHSESLQYYGKASGSKEGLIISDGMSDDEKYHLRIVQALKPALITKLADKYTALSLDGQELLHILNDEMYIHSLEVLLRREGYTSPSDVQIFKLLRKRLDGDTVVSWAEVMKMLMDHAINDPVPRTPAASYPDENLFSLEDNMPAIESIPGQAEDIAASAPVEIKTPKASRTRKEETL